MPFKFNIRRNKFLVLKIIGDSEAMPIKSVKIFSVIVLVSIWPGIAVAISDDLKRFANSSVHNALVYHIWVSQSNRMCGSKTPPKSLTPRSVAELGRVTFPLDSKFPLAGAWAESWKGQACGREVIFNFVCHAQGGKFPKCTFKMPGTTKANYILQRDVSGHLKGQLLGGENQTNCSTLNPIDSIGLDASDFFEDENEVPQGSFLERWTFMVCGERRTAKLFFFPNARGGMKFVIKAE